MDQSQYTLPGVMNFLRTEWLRKEQTAIEWEIERADLRSRIARLEAEKLELQRERDKAQRHLEILYGHKLSKVQPKPKAKTTTPNGDSNENTNVDSNGESSRTNSSGPSENSVSKDLANGKAPESSQTPPEEKAEEPEEPAGEEEPEGEEEEEEEEPVEVSDGLSRTVTESQEYLKQCVADIRHILRQTSTVQTDSESIVPAQPGLNLQSMLVLANFGGAPLTVAALPKGRVAAGTVDGLLLLWENGATEPIKFGSYPSAITCIRYSASSNRILVGVGASVQVFANTDTPSLLSTHEFGEFPVLKLAVAPNGNLIAIVQSNGAASVWSLQNGTDLIKMSDAGTGVSVCDFAEIASRDLHLVLARNSDTTDPDGPDGNLLLADPLTGQLLKKIVFSFSAGISAILLTPEAIVLGTDHGDLRVLGLARGETLAEVTAAHRSEITSLTLVKGHSLLSTSIDGRVSIWSLPSLLWSGRVFSHDSGYGALCSSSCDESVVVGGGDGIIRVYKD